MEKNNQINLIIKFIKYGLNINFLGRKYMKKGFSSIVGGLLLLFIATYYYLIYYQNPMSVFFTVLIGALGLSILTTGIFIYNKYYNRRVYLGLASSILVGMLISSTLQLFKSGFEDIITGIILILIFTMGIVYLTYKIYSILPILQKTSFSKSIELPRLPNNYKITFIIGYLAVLSFVIGIASYVFYKLYFGTLDGYCGGILILFGFIFYFYFNYKIKPNMLRDDRKILKEYYIINISFPIWIALTYLIAHFLQ